MSDHLRIKDVPANTVDTRLQSMQPLLAKLPPVINLLLLVLLGLALSRMFWLLWPAPAQDYLLPAIPGMASAKSGEKIDIERIVQARLFGKADAGQTVSAAPAVKVETRLNLVLKGIFAYNHPTNSRALIEAEGKTEKPYAIGEHIIRGATLDEIHQDYVVLSRDGRQEILKLERNKNSGSRSKRSARNTPINSNRNFRTPVQSRNSARNSTSQDYNLEQVRQEVLNDPSQISQYVRIQEYKQGGQLKGYRVYPGTQSGLFRQVGLRAGELVTAVNGVELNDPATALQMLGDLSQASEVTLTLERGGRTRTLNLSTNQ